MITRASFRSEYHAYRAARREYRNFRPCEYADRRDPFEGPRFPYPSALIARVIAPVMPTLRQQAIERCKRCPPHERSHEAAIAYGMKQVRGINRQIELERNHTCQRAA